MQADTTPKMKRFAPVHFWRGLRGGAAPAVEGCGGAERPGDVRLAPTGAERRTFGSPRVLATFAPKVAPRRESCDFIKPITAVILILIN